MKEGLALFSHPLSLKNPQKDAIPPLNSHPNLFKMRLLFLNLFLKEDWI